MKLIHVKRNVYNVSKLTIISEDLDHYIGNKPMGEYTTVTAFTGERLEILKNPVLVLLLALLEYSGIGRRITTK